MTLVPAPPNSGPDPLAPVPSGPTHTSLQDRRGLVRTARMLAMAVDFVQLVAVPFFMPGAASPVNDVVDLITAVVLTRLVGWHMAFLPTFLAELIPMVDLFPTWTVAVFFATMRRTGPIRGAVDE